MSSIDMVGNTVGARIKQAREIQKWSIEDLAQRIGVTRETIEAWETGERDPRANRIMILAGILNVSAHWLLDGTGDSPEVRDIEPIDAARGQMEAVKTKMIELNALLEEMDAKLNEV